MLSPRKQQAALPPHEPHDAQRASRHPEISRGYCFYLDVKDKNTAQTLIKRIEDLGLRRELVLTDRVTHVVSEGLGPWGGGGGEARSAERSVLRGGHRRADAMLERVLPLQDTPTHITITVQKAAYLLDKIYDSLYKTVPPISVKVLKAPFIKFEPFDRSCRPVYKELEYWPEIPTEPDLPTTQRTVRAAAIVPTEPPPPILLEDRMTRKHRPRKEETKETKSGYCEMCNSEYADVMVHRRSPQHLNFVRDSNNFRSLDALIHSGADVSAFLDKNAPVNGERRSLRKLCNGDADPVHVKTETTVNGSHSPRVNGLYEARKRMGRCRKSSSEGNPASEDRQYYKVVGVNTKLRSSGTFPAPRSPPPACNGESPGLVVKFRKVRRSELSVLSDEAEQFMFPRRPSTSSSSEEEEKEEDCSELRRSTRPIKEEVQDTSQGSERRRSARPTALKEESSEDDSYHEDHGRKRKRIPMKKSRLATSCDMPKLELPEAKAVVIEPILETVTPQEDLKDRCLKWEEGRLKAAPAVEELQFAFESVPKSEPWYESFDRQDNSKPISKNVPHYFALYATSSPKLPYEMGQLPPLKPNCCPLSELMKREDKDPGPFRSYGTRGNKKQKIRKRTTPAALIALEKHPRKSPREHASTLAILGGLLHRRKHQDDTKSTASEDTCSETNCNIKSELTQISDTQEQSERLQQFLSEVFEDAAEYEIPEEAMDGEATVATSMAPDVIGLVSECDNCDIIQKEVKEGAASRLPGPVRRGYKFKKKNRTGWPNKKKVPAARVASWDASKSETSGGETANVVESTVDSAHESTSEIDESTIASMEEASLRSETATSRSDRRENCTETEGSVEEGGSDAGWGAAALQPVVRVAKIDSAVARRLRSAAASSSRGARARRARAYRFR